jgi:AhpD family alkylhydroperoxidase
MQTKNHSQLMHDVNDVLGPFRASNKELMQGFGGMAKAAMASGEVSAKHKELTALALGISQHCSACIAFHIKALIGLGVTRGELEETLAVCVYMGGGPSLMYSAEAIATFEELTKN